MQANIDESIAKKQYSKAASRERDIIKYVATKEKAITKASMALAKTRREPNGGYHFAKILIKRYRSLLFIEYTFRNNCDKVIEIYKELVSKYAHVVMLGTQLLSSDVKNLDVKEVKLFYELALVKTKKSLRNISIIKSFILREMKNEPTKEKIF